MTFLERFSYIIKKLGGNGVAAEICGRSATSLVRYKRGHDIPFEVAYKLSEAAGVGIDWLANGDGEPEPKESEYRITAEIVEECAEAFLLYLKKDGSSLSPKDTAQVIALLCEVYEEQGRINVSFIERLMRLRGKIN